MTPNEKNEIIKITKEYSEKIMNLCMIEEPIDEDNKLKIRDQRIILEIGHGDHPDGYECGAVDPISRMKEHDLNKIVAESADNHLSHLGFKDITVTDSGDYLGNIGRAHSNCDVFISIHHNAFSDPRAQGSETLIHKDYWNPDDEKLAELLSEKMSSLLRIKNRGIKTMSLSVLKGAIQGAEKPGKAVCLIEPYFITGKDVNNHHIEWSRKAGEAVAIAVDEFLS